MRSMDEKTAAAMIDLLQEAEYRLVKVVANATEETVARDVALVLRDLAAIRYRLESPAPNDKRTHGRIHEPGVAVMRGANGHDESVAIHDISAGGALIECDTPPETGQTIVIELPGLDKAVNAVVRATAGTRAHLSFVALPPDDLVALLKYIERRFQRY